MRLYICRHGKAERDSHSGTDFDRALKDRGHRQAEYLGRQLARAAPRPVVVLVSPLVRAQQTADGILSVLQAERRDEPRLSTDHRAGDILDAVAEIAGDMPTAAGAVVVGHNPDLSMVAAMLLHGPGSHGLIGLRTGQCIACDIDPASPLGSGKNAASFRLE